MFRISEFDSSFYFFSFVEFNSGFLMKLWFSILEFHMVSKHFFFIAPAELLLFRDPFFLCTWEDLYYFSQWITRLLHYVPQIKVNFFFNPTDDPTSHYFLHPSDSALIVSELFIGENYTSWSRSISIACSVKNKLAFIDGSLPVPSLPLVLYTIVVFVPMT